MGQACRRVCATRFSVLDATLTAVLRGVSLDGKRLTQIGCNNGRELLSCFALGAVQGVGIDQSEAFLAQAEALNAVARRDCRFVRSDIYPLPADTSDLTCDVALITIGVLNWMPDLPVFFRQVARLVVSGGDVVIYETHPFLEVFDPSSDNPHLPSCSYFRTEPQVFGEALVYDGSSAGHPSPSYWFGHRMGDVFNAAIAAGFRLCRLEEYPHSTRVAEYAVDEGRLAQPPMCCSLVAKRC